ncbi:MAG: hypothetical protein OK438_00010 [Thaumarchaeota archaeon]|nr:hypothetical protein [Nitrososphaerota archaeon]
MALEGTGVRLDVRPVSSLLPHEETIPSHVERITKQLMQDALQKDPIVVDAESGTVLDGMHRLAAFKKLKIGNVICCSIDYSSKAVRLNRWARVYSSPLRDETSRLLTDLGLTKVTTIADAFLELEGRACGLAAFSSEGVYLPESHIGLPEAFEVVRRFDAFALSAGWAREFVPEDEIDSALQDPTAVLILVQRLTKDDVVRAARTGRFFPCKTSMHTIDPRPVAMNFPLAELEDLTGTELRRRLAASRSKLLPANSLYGGRRYKERLLLLNSP